MVKNNENLGSLLIFLGIVFLFFAIGNPQLMASFGVEIFGIKAWTSGIPPFSATVAVVGFGLILCGIYLRKK